MAIQATSAVPSAAANGKHGHSLISDEKFRQLYTLALKFRFAAERGVATLAGREAALAGVSADLRPDDVLIAEHQPAAFDPSHTEQHPERSDRPTPVSSMSERIMNALSTAVANRMQHNQRVTVLFYPQDPAGRLLSEARDLAAGARLPVIFVEQAHEPARRRSPLRQNTAADLISIPVDAHDVIAVYRVAHESIARARQGTGPTRIVCITLADDGRNNALINLETWLTARGLPAQQWRQEIVARVQTTESQDASGTSELPENAA